MRAVALLLFASTFAGQASFGDSGESIAGVRTLGILHAPGYPAYVLGARLFATLEPFGSYAFRVNLFSLVCAVGAVVVVFRLGRALKLQPAASAFAALSLAVATSFWFNAGFAKPYALTGLLLASVLLLSVRYLDDRRAWRLVLAGALVGLAGGASWQLMAVALPGIAVVLLADGGRPPVKVIAAAAGAGAVVLGGLLTFVLVRAGQDPALNWGDASTLDRLGRLVTARDFVSASGTSASAQGSGGGGRGPLHGFSRLPFRSLRVPATFIAELGLLVVAAGVVGAVSSFRQRLRHRVGLAVLAATNVVAVLVIVGGAGGSAFSVSVNGVIRVGPFFLGAVMVVALWAGMAADLFLRAAAGVRPSAPRSRADRRRQARSRGRAATGPAWVPISYGLLALALLVTAAFHWSRATHRTPPYAEQYAANVLASLPEDAVLLTWVMERNFPLLHAQLVQGRRPDVDVVLLEAFHQPWYRQQLAGGVGVALDEQPPGGQTIFEEALAYAGKVREHRPVFVDYGALILALETDPQLGFEPRGLVARLTDGDGAQDMDVAAVEELFASFATDGLYDGPARERFPNEDGLITYGFAHFDLGRELARAGDRTGAVEHFTKALQVDPDNALARQALDAVRAGRLPDGGGSQP